MRQIPVLDAGRGGAFALYQAAPAQTAELIETAMDGNKLLALAGRPGDFLSRRWLARRHNPFYDEIAAVADALGKPGVFLLNIVYEWSCSTSAGPDPTAQGNRMIRILDWGMPRLGRHVVIGRHASDHGAYYNATWPGYAGVLTAMAPGRFAAAINQAPRQTRVGLRWLDEAIVHLAMYRAPATLPAAHLLRRVFEAASDYQAAFAMLMSPEIALAMPALFTLSGTTEDDACVIEAIGRRRIAHHASAGQGRIVGVANQWLGSDLPGKGRDNALLPSDRQTPEANNAERRQAICALQRGVFAGSADLAPPLLNGHTVLVATANAAAGRFIVEAMEGNDALTILPRVVGRAEIG